MEKEQKIQLKRIKKEIKKSNILAQGFIKFNNYRPGSYEKLQKSDIWRDGKRQIIEYYRLQNIKMICSFCNNEISSNPILHHKAYNWNRLFSPKNVEFLHSECHNKLHSEKRGYKRGIWKKVLKRMFRTIVRRRRLW